MIAPLKEWLKRGSGQFNRYSPCKRYQIQKAYINGQEYNYAYPYPTGAKLGGPFKTSAEAWQCCLDDSEQRKAA